MATSTYRRSQLFKDLIEIFQFYETKLKFPYFVGHDFPANHKIFSKNFPVTRLPGYRIISMPGRKVRVEFKFMFC